MSKGAHRTLRSSGPRRTKSAAQSRRRPTPRDPGLSAREVKQMAVDSDIKNKARQVVLRAQQETLEANREAKASVDRGATAMMAATGAALGAAVGGPGGAVVGSALAACYAYVNLAARTPDESKRFAKLCAPEQGSVGGKYRKRKTKRKTRRAKRKTKRKR